jgi:hypothetical protein
MRNSTRREPISLARLHPHQLRLSPIPSRTASLPLHTREGPGYGRSHPLSTVHICRGPQEARQSHRGPRVVRQWPMAKHLVLFSDGRPLLPQAGYDSGLQSSARLAAYCRIGVTTAPPLSASHAFRRT